MNGARSHTTITIRPRHRSARDDGFVVEVDPRLPDSVVGRTVYHSPRDRYVGPAHRHPGHHDVVCLAGRCRVALWSPADAAVVWHTLGPGDLVHVPPLLGHRVLLCAGSVVAATSPAVSWLAAGDVEELTGGEWEEPR